MRFAIAVLFLVAVVNRHDAGEAKLQIDAAASGMTSCFKRSYGS